MPLSHVEILDACRSNLPSDFHGYVSTEYRCRPAIIIHSPIDRGPSSPGGEANPLARERVARKDRKLAEDSNHRERRSQNARKSVPVNCLVIVAVAVIYDP